MGVLIKALHKPTLVFWPADNEPNCFLKDQKSLALLKALQLHQNFLHYKVGHKNWVLFSGKFLGGQGMDLWNLIF